MWVILLSDLASYVDSEGGGERDATESMTDSRDVGLLDHMWTQREVGKGMPQSQ